MRQNKKYILAFLALSRSGYKDLDFCSRWLEIEHVLSSVSVSILQMHHCLTIQTEKYVNENGFN